MFMGTGIALLAAALNLAAGHAQAGSRAPERLAGTGLFVAGSVEKLAAGVRGFTPQYPLWSDGATKRRWIALPQAGAIDATRPAAWEFPAGTKFWKEFSVDGRRVETRSIERLPDGEWRFTAYAWNDAQTEAALAPAEGMTVSLPGGRYRIPGESDCRACHEGAASPILGFTALQLSTDRDPLAPNGEPLRDEDLTLATLVADGRLAGMPDAMLKTPPRVAAPTPAGRAALGYLNANCGHCHADPKLAGAAVPVELQLAIDPADPAAADRILRLLTESESRYRPAGAAAARLVVPGDASAGTLMARVRSRDPRTQMPPLGTSKPDAAAIALLERWINEDMKNLQERTP
jgi:hypothetical protein